MYQAKQQSDDHPAVLRISSRLTEAILAAETDAALYCVQNTSLHQYQLKP